MAYLADWMKIESNRRNTLEIAVNGMQLGKMYAGISHYPFKLLLMVVWHAFFSPPPPPPLLPSNSCKYNKAPTNANHVYIGYTFDVIRYIGTQTTQSAAFSKIKMINAQKSAIIFWNVIDNDYFDIYPLINDTFNCSCRVFILWQEPNSCISFA